MKRANTHTNRHSYARYRVEALLQSPAMTTETVTRELPDGVIERYCAADIDIDFATRQLSGIAMRYGDIAQLPWGEREQFKPGAFGDLTRADVILDVQHNRDRLLARTGGDLMLADSRAQLRLETTVPKTTEGDNALELVRTKVLRGFSVQFRPVEWTFDKKQNLTIIERATLVRIALVDIPMYAGSVVDQRQDPNPGGTPVDQDKLSEQVREMVEGILAKREGDSAPDATTIAKGIVEGLAPMIESTIADQVRAQLEEADAKRTKAEADRKDADEKRAQAEADAKKAAGDADARAEARADLLIQIRELLPDDTETRGKSDKELLVLAVGDEVPDAENRSEDYLRAKVEGIVERRAEAAPSPGSSHKRSGTPGAPPVSMGSAPIGVLDMPRLKS